MEMADLLPIEEYIQKRKATVMIFTEDRKVYSDCKQSSHLTKNDRSLISMASLRDTKVFLKIKRH